MRRYSKVLTAVLVCLSFLVCGLSIEAQQDSRASLQGKVVDSSGAVIPNASVDVKAIATGVVLTAKTNASGVWAMQYLLPGAYSFKVSAAGFKSILHPSVELQVGDIKYFDTTLQVGSSAQTVIVHSETPLLNTSSAMSGTVVNSSEMGELPSQSNSPTMMIGLATGAVVSSGVGGGVYLWSNGGLSGTVINQSGSGAQAINYSVDGGNDTNNAGGIAFEPPMDAVKQFRVVTNAYDASIGRQGSGTVNLTLRNGTDQFHGDMYYDNQNNTLNAKYFNNLPKKPAIHLNYYGGSLGGPVWIPKLYNGIAKKTFFYYSFAGIRNKAPYATGTISLPTAAERQGDFSHSFTTQIVNGIQTVYPVKIYNPATWNYDGKGDREPFANNIIPSTMLDGPAQAFLKLVPLPETAGDGSSSDSNNYAIGGGQDDKFAGNTLRLDQTWNNNNRSYAEFRQNSWSELSYDPFGPNAPYVYADSIYQKRSNKAMTLDHTIVLRSNLLADLKYSVMRWEAEGYNAGAGLSQTSLGFSPDFAALSQLKSIPMVTGISSISLGTSNANNYTFDTNQDIDLALTQTLGNQNLSYGFDYMIQQEADGGLGASGGSFDFANNWTTKNPNSPSGVGEGDNLASMLLGLPTSGSIPTNTNAFWSQHYMGLYLQDDWRATSRLTVNAGLRWDYERPLTERYNRFFSRYDTSHVITQVTDPAQAAYNAEVLGGNGSSNSGIQLLQQYRPDASSFAVAGGVQYAGVDGVSRYVINPRYRYFQPRVGFAYQVHPDTVLRGGYGRFVQADFHTDATSQSGYSATTPYIATTNNYETINGTWDNPFPNGLVKPAGNSLGELTNVGSTTAYTDPNLGRVYTDTASLEIEQQIKQFVVTIGSSYDATHNIPLAFSTNLPGVNAWRAANAPAFNPDGSPVTTLAGNMQVPNPFKGVPYITNGIQNNTTITASQLLNPNPLVGTIAVTRSKGKLYYYDLHARVERRFINGFTLISSFIWSKAISENDLIGQQVVAQKIERRLSPTDNKFHYTMSTIYDLPFGRGRMWGANSSKLLDEAIGGWELTAQYSFMSGTPLLMPTNSAFFEGGDPSLGKQKTKEHWFNTSKFAPFPSSNTTQAALADYPTWTGVSNMPGASYRPNGPSGPQNGVYQDFATWNTYNQTTFGDIRNPYLTNLDLGLRKSFSLVGHARFQVRMDAFNALNHPRFGNIDTNPGDTYFGAFSGSNKPSMINAPRQIQLGGKITF